MWIIIQTGLELPRDGTGELVSCANWDTSIMKKVKVDANATCMLQCELTKEELNKVGSFSSAKELWNKLIELHEGALDAKEGETASQLHARIQDLLNSLHAIGQRIENRDVIRRTVFRIRIA
ncbi:uncharacterized protein LOC121995279 [Zingiber officinale]|uniref:uncharacterized protein LOC121995279 n=1 Tax=Zingiber officinale TaxID=94328 RepID=UPI001C4DAF5C|nr:uncharacterized protein LOC121995279 [Zingiber officinale]